MSWFDEYRAEIMSSGLKNALARFVERGRRFRAIRADSDDLHGKNVLALEARPRRLEDQVKGHRCQPSPAQQA